MYRVLFSVLLISLVAFASVQAQTPDPPGTHWFGTKLASIDL